MTRYSIRKLGCEYVIFADEQSILRTASRRKAVKIIAEAAELLSVQSVGAAGTSRDDDQPAVTCAKFLDDTGRFPY